MEWQPIETAPRDRTVILLRGRGMRHADGFWEPEAYAGNGSWVWPYVHCEPINWMPLPEQEKVGAGDTVKELTERLAESERQRDALLEELENIATAEWREFDPDTRRCAYEFVLWAQSRARHTLNRVLRGDVTAPLPEDVRLVQVGPCSCSDHECGECMKPEEDPAQSKLDEMVLREK